MTNACRELSSYLSLTWLKKQARYAVASGSDRELNDGCETSFEPECHGQEDSVVMTTDCRQSLVWEKETLVELGN